MIENFAFLYNAINYVTVFIDDLFSVLIQVGNLVEFFENLT